MLGIVLVGVTLFALATLALWAVTRLPESDPGPRDPEPRDTVRLTVAVEALRRKLLAA